MPVEPKIAATVVLLRERVPDLESQDDCEFEVFMVKRHGNARFLSDYHAFPGGSIDKQDLNEESKSRLIGIDKNTLNNLKDVCEDPAILWIIAIRELFEETGLLIAGNDETNPIGFIEGFTKKFNIYQAALQEKKINMTTVLVTENLYYTANKLVHFGRYITPELSPIRFDTQFFLCEFPHDQNINLFLDELTEGQWGSPKQFIKKFRNKEIKLIFPQYSTLKRLKRYRTIREVFENSKELSSRNRLTSFW
ncbi:MAG: hypothetical protein KGD73_10680 [Candidatus Lokiarchaeota archaeon]|nr:hypothetical protein [Candidatus Lokiarchaeota archaeon]